MEIINTISELRARLDDARQDGDHIGFVPTMGALHDGHRSLVETAVEQCDFVVVSVFVNPLQFGEGEDLDAYPRTLEADSQMAAEAGARIVFAPSANEMYPEPMFTLVRVNELSHGLESMTRPTHFDGVTTVVSKLFNIVGPCSAFFGEKDYQQLALIRRMASDLAFPVAVVGCETVREHDGLAMSSRNQYLQGADRDAAVVLSVALGAGRELIESGETSPAVVEEAMASVVAAEPLASLDYAAVRDRHTLEPLAKIDGEVRLLIAAAVGPTRLIDNIAAG